MRRLWGWVAGRVPERVLRTLDSVPFIIQTRRERWQSEKNAFDLGRDYGRTEMGGPAVPPDRPQRHLTAV